jgi:hypothetical protein
MCAGWRHREGDARLSAWLAPELDHLPVRLVLIQPNGDQLEQALGVCPEPRHRSWCTAVYQIWHVS